jgi:type IV pilus assembly protein PilA
MRTGARLSERCLHSLTGDHTIKRKWKWALVGTAAVAAASGLWLAYVAQSGYTPRAKISEGLNLAGAAKTAVAEYYAARGRFPVDSNDAGFPHSISGRFVSDVSVMANGVIQVTYGGTEPDEVIAGKILILQAIVAESSDDITWSCTVEQLAERHIPAACR